MMARFMCLLAMSALTMAGATALVYGSWRGWVVGMVCVVLSAYAALMAMNRGEGDDR